MTRNWNYNWDVSIMQKSDIMKNYRFLAILIGAMILGCIVGWFAPGFAGAIKPLGTVFINMMFCIVVPLVFASISGSIAGMRSKKRAGKILGTTVATFVITGAIAAVIMFGLVTPPEITGGITGAIVGRMGVE